MKTTSQKPKKHKARKILIAVAVILLVLILIVGIVIPAFISSESGRKTILTKINESVDGTTDFASLSMGWFSGVKLTDLSFNDDAGQTNIRIKQIQTRPHYGSILAGNLSFGKTVIDEPKVAIDLRKSPAPTVASADGVSKQKTAAAPQLPISKINLQINNGDVKITDAKSNTIHLADINSSLDLKGPDKMNRFAADITLADSQTTTPIHAEGSINPKKISGDLIIKVNDLNLNMLGPLFDLAEVQLDAKGRLTANITTQFKDSKLQNLTGTAVGTNLDIGGAAIKGDRFKTSNLNLDVKMAQQKNLINIEKLTLNTDWAKVQAEGKIPTGLESLSQFLEPKADFDLKGTIDVDLPAVASQMPNTLNLKPGTAITSGKLTGDIARTRQADTARIEANFRIANLAGLVDRQPVAISEPIEAQALISSDKSAINFEQFHVNSSFAQISCTGTEKLLSYDLKANLQKLQSELGSFLNFGGYKTAGLVTGTGKIAAAEKNINLTGTSTIQNFHLTTPDGQTASEPQANLNMDLDISRKTNDVAVTKLDCVAGFGNFRIDNGYLPSEKTAAKPLTLPITADIDLAKTRPFAMLSSAYPKKLFLSGNAVSKLRITIDDKTTKIFTDSTQLKDFTYGTSQSGQVSLGLVIASIDATAGIEKTEVRFDVTNPAIKAKGNFNIDTNKNIKTMTAKANCDYDWKLVSRLLSAFMPEDLLIEGKNKTDIEFAASYPADKPDRILANLNFTKPIKVAFDKAQYRGFNVTEPSQIQVNFANGLLDIPEFSMKVNEGTFNFAGQADFKQPATVFRTPKPMNILQNVKIDERVSSKLLQYINPIFKDVDRISGTASFSCQRLVVPLKGATKRDLELDGTFSVSNMRMASPIFNLIQQLKGGTSEDSLMQLRPTRITAQNGLVRYDNMQLDVGNNPFNFVGRIDLLTKNIEGTKVITPYTTSRTVRIGEENTQGRITGNFKGTYDNPELDWGSLIIDTLIQEGLREVLKNL